MTDTPSTTKLVARTRRLDTEVDLVDLAGERGVLFAGGRRSLAGVVMGDDGHAGAAARIDVPRSSPAEASAAVHEALAAIEVLDEVGQAGCGPVAVGALPFAPDRPAHLTVPEVLVGGGEDGTRWLTTVLPAEEGEDGHRRRRAAVLDHLAAGAARRRGTATWSGDELESEAPPTAFHVSAPRDPADWCAAVAAAAADLRAGAARKVVLAREVLVESDRPLSRRAILARLRGAYPGCMLFAVDGFIGATPELLVSRLGDLVRAQPMAGTVRRSADPTTDARLAATLLASTKDREEHRFTIDFVHETLLPFCSYLDEEAEPSVVAMANVAHLATRVEGRLSAPPASAVELMTALHPTPAVGGEPREAALALMARHELLDRGPFGGPVGWVDAAGNGEWAVGIRSAELAGNRGRLFAGVGVVADSDPDAELAETQAKLQAVLSAIVRP